MSARASDLSSTLHVRPVGGERAAAFAGLHLQAFDRAWSAHDLQRVMEGPCTFGLEAMTPDDACSNVGLAGPFGFILVRAVAGEAEILTLAVHPNARRKGIGRSLVQAAATTAQGLGAKAFWLEVAVDNEPAIALYAATGFQAAGRRPNYYSRKGGERVDALVMRRMLNSAAA